MVNKKLQQAGNELGVSEKDLAKLRRQRIKRKLLYPAIGAIFIGCSALIGFFAGRANLFHGGGYPYAAMGLALTPGPKRKKEMFVLVTVLLTVGGAIAAAMAAYKAGQHSVHHVAMLYSAFSRQR
ncbi:MAG: hypothetical protein FJ012_08555 [Chloroflexi bacterium]|nr:hypothetical protein [Chloroflexota bacterium]